MFRRLLIATVVGILAAFAVAGFRHAMLLLEWLFLNNDSGSLVNAATNLSPWRRLLQRRAAGHSAAEAVHANVLEHGHGLRGVGQDLRNHRISGNFKHNFLPPVVCL